MQKILVVGDPYDCHMRKRLCALKDAQFIISLVSPRPVTLDLPVGEQFIVDLTQPTFLKRLRQWCLYASFLGKNDWDLICVSSADLSIGWLTHFFSNKPVVVITFGSDIFRLKTRHFIVKKCIVSALQSASRVTVLTQYMKDYLARFCVKGHVMQDYWGIDKSWFQMEKGENLEKSLGIESNSPIIFSCRVLDHIYRIDHIIEAVALLKKTYPRVKLIQSQYLSNNAYKKDIEKRIKKLNLEDNVCFLPEQFDTPSFRKIYSLSDVVVMTPTSDGMPSSLIEAWAQKKPVVTSDIPHYDPKWDETMLLKSKVDAVSLERSLRFILENSEFREKIFEAGYRYAKSHYKGTALKDPSIFKGPFPYRSFLQRFRVIGWFVLYMLMGFLDKIGLSKR